MKRIPVLILVLAAAISVVVTYTAAAVGAAADAEACFGEDEFLTAGAVPDGIYLSAVPAASFGKITLGNRVLRAGDVIPSAQLSDLRLEPTANASGESALVYYPITDGHVGEAQSVGLSLFSKKNEPPSAKDGKLETYKNVARNGSLSADDPEGGKLRFELVKPPKHGLCELNGDGSFTYTPGKNKVGRDQFIFVAVDEAGERSEEATVEIRILKPSDQTSYADMQSDPQQFEAMWLREAGLFTGETISGNLCFGPEKDVTRGEFLAMTMRLVGAKTSGAALSTGFSDEAQTPAWMQPYIATALQRGLISGVASDDGMVFRPDASVTRAEAAVFLQNALRLPADEEAAVFDTDAAPVWARSSLHALACAGIELEPSQSADVISRRDAAKLLRKVAELLESNAPLKYPS